MPELRPLLGIVTFACVLGVVKGAHKLLYAPDVEVRRRPRVTAAPKHDPFALRVMQLQRSLDHPSLSAANSAVHRS